MAASWRHHRRADQRPIRIASCSSAGYEKFIFQLAEAIGLEREKRSPCPEALKTSGKVRDSPCVKSFCRSVTDAGGSPRLWQSSLTACRVSRIYGTRGIVGERR